MITSSITKERRESVPRDRPTMGSIRVQSWLLLTGLWMVLPMVVAGSTDLAMGRPVSLPRLTDITHYVLVWWPWIPLTPFITALGRRLPIRSPGALKHALIHLMASWTVAVLVNLSMATLAALLPVGWSPTFILSQALHIFEGFGALSQILYWTVLAISFAFASYQRSRERRALLAEARLESLKAQVHPHFLFNTLNTISTLMDEDVQAARRMIAHLSELLRASLRGPAGQEVALGDELELVKLYLDIEKVRFEDRLRLEFAIEPETRDALVPHLLLQPLVENAIRHGISRDSTAGLVRLEAQHRDGVLRLRIEDDGPGPPEQGAAGPNTGGGIGLANVRARLEELYGRDGRLELRHRQPRGATVEVAMPFHLQRVEVSA